MRKELIPAVVLEVLSAEEKSEKKPIGNEDLKEMSQRYYRQDGFCTSAAAFCILVYVAH